MKKLHNIIAVLAIIVIIISLWALGSELTGMASDNGIINISIDTTTAINFTTDLIDFGNGSLNPGAQNATLDTLGNVINGNWSSTTSKFTVENIGNTNVTLDLRTGKNATVFLGGTSPAYQYNISNAEAGSCVNATGFNLGSWNDVNTSNPGTRICDIFQYQFGQDSILIDLKLVVPSDVTAGAKSDTFTATGTAV